MQFGLPFIDVLIIPSGAGPGDERVVIDGTTGQITIYDSHDHIVGQFGPDGSDNATLFVQSDTGSKVTLVTTLGSTFATFRPPDTVGLDITSDGFVSGDIDNGVGDRPFLLLSSPSIESKSRARLFLNSRDNDDNNGPHFVFESTDAEPIEIYWEGYSGSGSSQLAKLGLGLVPNGFQQFTGNSAGIAAGNDTDHSRTVGIQENHVYRIVYDGQFATGGAGTFLLGVERDGTFIGSPGLAVDGAATHHRFTQSICYQAPDTDPSTTFTLINHPSSSGNIQLIAQADNPRSFYVEDIGRG